jgi:hypothetical protein
MDMNKITENDINSTHLLKNKSNEQQHMIMPKINSIPS